MDLLLGTDTDRAVAGSLRKTERAVWKRRREFGIPAFRLGALTRGRIVDNHSGYVLLKIGSDDPLVAVARSDGYVLEHRIVVARSLGRPLTRDEIVHHKNGVKDDNRLDNLELWTRAHPDGQRVEDVFDWAVAFVERYALEVAHAT
jgi:hypothetical protein